jgi:hypothetical protein
VKLNRALWAIDAEWIEEDIKGIVSKGDIDSYEFLTISRWSEDKEKAKKSWQKANPAYKVINIEFKGFKTIQNNSKLLNREVIK